jgi:hypothetical protein
MADSTVFPNMSLRNILLSGFALSSLAAAQLCGPDSNCDFYTDDNGRQRIRFREGMGRGTKAYEAIFGTDEDIQASLADEITTQITMSDTPIQYGCDTDIASTESMKSAPLPEVAWVQNPSRRNFRPYDPTVAAISVLLL